nr:RhuM family protein [Halomonas subglaciescola]
MRASEKRFYQEVRDLFALSSDYLSDDRDAHWFFAEVQNKLLLCGDRPHRRRRSPSRRAICRWLMLMLLKA